LVSDLTAASAEISVQTRSNLLATASKYRSRLGELPITLAVFAIYAVLAQVAYWPVFPGTSNRVATCACSDASLQSWLLGWIPFSLGHLHNPFFTSWTNYPFGVNLAQNTSMPLLGLLASPLTVLAGPITSYNLLLLMSFPLSAISMYWVMRQWTGSRLAAFAAGLLYGFSAYMVVQGQWHIMLTFVPLPPLFFYQLHKLVIRRDGRPYLHGALLGLIASAQLLISTEIMVSMALFGVIALALYALAEFRSIRREHVTYVLRGLLTAAGIVAVVAAYPLGFALFGSQHFREPVRAFDNEYHGVVLGAILPTAEYHSPLTALARYGHKLNGSENGQYLGIPLILLIGLFVVWYRRNRALLMSVTLALIAYVLALGPHLNWVHQANGTIPLPFDLLRSIPLANNLVPDRLSLYSNLFLATAVALAIAELSKPVSDGNVRGLYAQRSGLDRTRALRVRRLGASFVGAFAVIALIPAWPYHSYPANIPHFFLSSEVGRIPVDSSVLTYPFPYYPVDQAMSWESVTGMRFKEVGTYALVRGRNGVASVLPPLLSPRVVEAYLVNAQSHRRGYSLNEPLRQLVVDVRTFASTWKLRAVIVNLTDPTVPHVPDVVTLFTNAFGRPTGIGGVDLWLLPPGNMNH
jgi:hypothetical protein